MSRVSSIFDEITREEEGQWKKSVNPHLLSYNLPADDSLAGHPIIQSIQMVPKHQIELTVRDYECDLQGIVNNAVYLNYLEHARHTYLLERNIDFAKLHTEGIDLVVHRIEIDYKQSLTSGDRFQVTSSMRKEGPLRVIFDQEIARLPDMKPVVKAKVTGVGVRNGRPMRVSDIAGFQELD